MSFTPEETCLPFFHRGPEGRQQVDDRDIELCQEFGEAAISRRLIKADLTRIAGGRKSDPLSVRIDFFDRRHGQDGDRCSARGYGIAQVNQNP